MKTTPVCAGGSPDQSNGLSLFNARGRVASCEGYIAIDLLGASVVRMAELSEAHCAERVLR